MEMELSSGKTGDISTDNSIVALCTASVSTLGSMVASTKAFTNLIRSTAKVLTRTLMEANIRGPGSMGFNMA